MKNLRRLETLEKPSPIQQLGNNTYYYNYDIRPCKIHQYESETGEKVIKDGWSYIPVYITGQPDYNLCVKNIIRLHLSQDEEFDLINSYNKSIIYGKKEITQIADYKKYLELVDEIKTNVRKTFTV